MRGDKGKRDVINKNKSDGGYEKLGIKLRKADKQTGERDKGTMLRWHLRMGLLLSDQKGRGRVGDAKAGEPSIAHHESVKRRGRRKLEINEQNS